MDNKQKVASDLYNTIAEAIFKQGLTIKDVLLICGNVVNDNLTCASEREYFLTNALWESFNVNSVSFSKYSLFSLAPAISVVFSNGITCHSINQKKNFLGYKTAFLKLDKSDRDFLIEKYPNLKILLMED